MRVVALRGANEVTENTAEAILSATDRLMREILARNALGADDLVSCIFTLTPDLDAQFPAAAARAMGLSSVPLLCAREIPVPGALPKIIRVLIHAYMDHPAEHVYLGEAAKLRLDLAGAQQPRRFVFGGHRMPRADFELGLKRLLDGFEAQLD